MKSVADMNASALVDAIVHCFERGGKVMVFGNGGSAAQASHFVGELVGSFANRARPPLSAITLCADAATMTAIANDFGYEEVFARQVRALAGDWDIAIGLSTSGTSPSVTRALHDAECCAIMITGERRARDQPWRTIEVPGDTTAEIQEATLALIHRVCGEVEAAMFGDEAKGAA